MNECGLCLLLPTFFTFTDLFIRLRSVYNNPRMNNRCIGVFFT